MGRGASSRGRRKKKSLDHLWWFSRVYRFSQKEQRNRDDLSRETGHARDVKRRDETRGASTGEARAETLNGTEPRFA